MESHKDERMGFSGENDFENGLDEFNIYKICDELKIEIKHEPMEENLDDIRVNNKIETFESNIRNREIKIKSEGNNKTEPEVIKQENRFISKLFDFKDSQVSLMKSSLDDNKMDNIKDTKIEIKHEELEVGCKDVDNKKCKMDYTNNYNPKDHLLKKTKENPYKCGDCNSSFMDKCKHLQHKKVCAGERSHQCNDCGRLFVEKGQLIKHLMMHDEENKEIRLCKSYLTQTVLNKACANGANVAKDVEIDIKHEPAVGDWNIDSIKHKVDEKKYEHVDRNIEIKQENKYNTDLCKSVLVPSDLNKPRINHLQTLNCIKEKEIDIKQEPLDCDDWGAASMIASNDLGITSFKDENVPIKNEVNVKTELDKTKIDSFDSRKTFIEYGQEAIKVNKEHLKCQGNAIQVKNVIEICGGKFCLEDVENINQEENQIHPESLAFVKNEFIGKDQKEYVTESVKQSENCNKTSKYNEKLIFQKRGNAEETVYECTQCDKVFSSVKSRRKHVKTHIADKPYQCIDCGMTFLRKSILMQHQMVHIQEKPHQCTQCEKSYTRIDNLRIHLMKHTEDTLYLNNNVATQKSQVIENEGTHNDEKKYQCNHCDRAFMKNDELINHMRTHIEEKRFSCSLCNKTFAGNHFLIRHLQIHARENLYQCSKCDTSFSDNEGLTKHQKIHSGENSYQCRQCKKYFSEMIGITGDKTNLCIYCDSECSKNDNQSNQRNPSNIPSYNVSKNLRTKCKDNLNVKQDDDNQIIYIGCIANSTKLEIRKRFRKFGTIKNISISFRGQRNSYSFITFTDQIEANQAIEYGNDDISLPQYYICSKEKYENDKVLEHAGDLEVIYIGCISEGTSKAELRDRFNKFGTIRDISMVFREQRNNYCHIRFGKPSEAYEAVKHGNDDTKLPYYYLSLRNRISYEEDDFDKQEGYQQIVYIGCIADGTSVADIRERFSKFGIIMDISLIFRDHRINYGFVTYSTHNEACKAIAHGNDDKSYPQYYILTRKRYEEDKLADQVDEPRVMYIGCIAEGTTLADIRNRFSKFGFIHNISLNFKGRRNNYGHIKFAHRHDAYTAIAHGNDKTTLPQYYLCMRGDARRDEEDKFIKKQGEDRKVIYITEITEETTNIDLRNRFEKFGTITHICLASKGKKNYFSFIAFRNQEEAYEAVKHGNDDQSLPQYYISLGGRRVFCKRGYADLDAQSTDDTVSQKNKNDGHSETSEASMNFDDLLKAAMKKKR